MRTAALVCALCLIVGPATAGTDDHSELKNLGQLRIVVEDLTPDEERVGLSAAALESQALVDVKRNIPKMKIVDYSDSYMVSSGSRGGLELDKEHRVLTQAEPELASKILRPAPPGSSWMLWRCRMESAPVRLGPSVVVRL